ncbi:hypothetical protein [Streptomyces sp. NPDC090053]|uniref:hypothetical protein n=1 Tax=Streptomyces sp. NPDC090053 TaxID=3365932 RepID=UPI003828FD82
MPAPVVSAPEPRGVPSFPPLRVRSGRHRLWQALNRRRRAMAAGLVLAAVAPTLWASRDTGPAAAQAAAHAGERAGTQAGGPTGERARERTEERAGVRASPAVPGHGPPDLVSAPVRIADAATVRLLAPGDRVDVIAAGDTTAGPATADTGTGTGTARVVARGVRVADVPAGAGDSPVDDGALIVLAVPRATATALAGAGATSRLAVTMC